MRGIDMSSMRWSTGRVTTCVSVFHNFCLIPSSLFRTLTNLGRNVNLYQFSSLSISPIVPVSKYVIWIVVRYY
jgi:hypothetical protein